jgi:hypothetical protein
MNPATFVKNLRPSARLGLIGAAIAIAIAAPTPALAQRRGSTRTPSSTPNLPSSSFIRSRDGADTLKDFLLGSAEYDAAKKQGQQFQRSAATEAQERGQIRGEAARLNSVVCRKYEDATEFDGPGGSIVRIERSPASDGPAFAQGRPGARPATQADEDAWRWREMNTLRSPVKFCEQPPLRLEMPGGPLSGPSLGPLPPQATWRPGEALPPLPRLDAPWTRGPSLLNPSSGPWDPSRYSLGSGASSLSRDNDAWMRSMEAKHPWLRR